MPEYVDRQALKVAGELVNFIENEALPGTGLEADQFWSGCAALMTDLAPLNRELLAERDAMQAAIDSWHRQERSKPHDSTAYRQFLESIGYLVPEGEPFEIDTDNVDPEIGLIAAPQLVVPVMNARFALNAANARWGSLYDALYGSDVIAPKAEIKGTGYDEARGSAVIAWSSEFLDSVLPFERGLHADVTAYAVESGDNGHTVSAILADETPVRLANPDQFRGFVADGECFRLLFAHNGLHFELHVDRNHPVGRQSPSGLADVILEAAVTTIQDCEDSVAAVDAEDKVKVYRNWLGLMKGDLVDSFEKNGQQTNRRLAEDRTYTGSGGDPLVLPGRSLMLVRNVGHLMTTDAVLDAAGDETPEGMLDGLVTVLAAMHDLRKIEGIRNSRSGSVYIVKPKMHGPKEVAFANTLFDRIEDVLGLERHTIKMGVMDEERRTSANLRECIRAARHRLIFINTGFLDRTGDEIHTSMQAGPVVPKGEIKDAAWLASYEDNNVDQGLASGFEGRAQIGKGMWAKPDRMKEMLADKIGQARSGANTAWVPSPTAAVLHATHYHQVDVATVRADLRQRPPIALDTLLTPPLLGARNLPDETIRRELDNNCQSILGYVVRWIDQGIGCSKVPDIDDVSLMEDRATLRISAQHIANWLEHGLLSSEEIEEAMRRMAAVVDKQNAGDPSYRPMATDPVASISFQTALELVLEGAHQPNGYTEPVLHRRRREAKAAHKQ
ncbi:malate synthase G [Devosia pacifica]|nr:malate synthase G [Devosia pacifica]